ncbi:protein kinase [Candidatus Woesearchaeota archaeon]|jgi:hypothetical protein|nr:protein kinase [Candidatus Woesearchaeota archaeon]MBT6518573.1 protein kinase [Candidatus Woesearchaeota archaeon]MBT7366915.1 protein kinase [Candidatus Woesearchaeota archaeon]
MTKKTNSTTNQDLMNLLLPIFEEFDLIRESSDFYLTTKKNLNKYISEQKARVAFTFNFPEIAINCLDDYLSTLNIDSIDSFDLHSVVDYAGYCIELNKLKKAEPYVVLLADKLNLLTNNGNFKVALSFLNNLNEEKLNILSNFNFSELISNQIDLMPLGITKSEYYSSESFFNLLYNMDKFDKLLCETKSLDDKISDLEKSENLNYYFSLRILQAKQYMRLNLNDEFKEIISDLELKSAGFSNKFSDRSHFDFLSVIKLKKTFDVDYDCRTDILSVVDLVKDNYEDVDDYWHISSFFEEIVNLTRSEFPEFAKNVFNNFLNSGPEKYFGHIKKELDKAKGLTNFLWKCRDYLGKEYSLEKINFINSILLNKDILFNQSYLKFACKISHELGLEHDFNNHLTELNKLMRYPKEEFDMSKKLVAENLRYETLNDLADIFKARSDFNQASNAYRELINLYKLKIDFTKKDFSRNWHKDDNQRKFDELSIKLKKLKMNYSNKFSKHQLSNWNKEVNRTQDQINNLKQINAHISINLKAFNSMDLIRSLHFTYLRNAECLLASNNINAAVESYLEMKNLFYSWSVKEETAAFWIGTRAVLLSKIFKTTEDLPSLNFMLDNNIVLEGYTITKKLGKGAFSDVYLGKNVVDEMDEAVKIIQISDFGKQLIEESGMTQEQFISKELQVRKLNSLRSHNIVLYHNVAKVKDKVVIFMEPFEMTLETALIENNLTYFEKVNCFADIAATLTECYDKLGIIHKDLKPVNAGLDSNKEIKLTDFGSIDSFSAKNYSDLSNIEYRAPEIWEGEKATFSSSIWAMGGIFFRMLTDKKLFEPDNLDKNKDRKEYETYFKNRDWQSLEEQDSKYIADSMIHPNVRFIPGSVYADITFMIQTCLTYDPKKREDRFRAFLDYFNETYDINELLNLENTN